LDEVFSFVRGCTVVVTLANIAPAVVNNRRGCNDSKAGSPDEDAELEGDSRKQLQEEQKQKQKEELSVELSVYGISFPREHE